jgi:hypothetical protein
VCIHERRLLISNINVTRGRSKLVSQLFSLLISLHPPQVSLLMSLAGGALLDLHYRLLYRTHFL